jgi:hypothetical protein
LQRSIQIDKSSSIIILQEVLEELQSDTENCSWFISSDKLISILNVNKEEYYRKLYSLRNSEFNPAGLRGFHETEGKALCRLLSELLKIDYEIVEEEFLIAGIYFGEDSLSEINDTFIWVLETALKKHKLDKELLMLLVTSTLSFDDAFDSYFDDKFDIENLIHRTVHFFTKEYHINTNFGAEHFLKNFLFLRVRLKKISMSKITGEYKDRYFYEMYGKIRAEKPKNQLTSEILILLRYFKLDEYTDKKILKKRYQELLKIYHPDINKGGLEKTKEIIHNFKKLNSLLTV